MDIEQLQQGELIRGERIDASEATRASPSTPPPTPADRSGSAPGLDLDPRAEGNPVDFGMPNIIGDDPTMAISIGLLLALMCLILIPFLGAGHSPHTLLRPSDSNVRLNDVVGAEATRREAIDTLNLFLAHETFAAEMGGTPRRGVLFEGPPGTGKTYLAKALAAEAGVPFLFVSASEFQSMYYGQTNRKIRTYFKALRKAARAEGGAIGFIEEFDAIGGARSGMNSGSMREGIVGVVNELLVQMQSFDMPTGRDKMKSKFIDAINVFLPAQRALPRPRRQRRPTSWSSRPPTAPPTSTRRCCGPAASTASSTSICRPAPTASRSPSTTCRRSPTTTTVNPFVVADLTAGYTPVKIERLLDEALIVALRHRPPGDDPRRRGRGAADRPRSACRIRSATTPTSAGGSPSTRPATHWSRRWSVARSASPRSCAGRGALGLVSHGDAEERHLKTPTEGVRADRRRPRRPGGRDPGVRRGVQRHRLRPGLRDHARVAAGRSARRRRQPDQPRGGHDARCGNLVAKVLADETSRQKVETSSRARPTGRRAWCSSTVRHSSASPTRCACTTS